MSTARRYGGKTLEERRGDQWDRLITAACEVFARRGYTSAGVDEIVAAARVSRSSFYAFFANKEECLLAVVRAGTERINAGLAEVIAQELEPAERIRAEITALAEGFAADPDMARVILIEAVGATPKIERARSGFRQAATDLIDAQLREYPVWRDRPAERAVVALATMAAIAESLSHLIATDRIAEWPSIVEPLTAYVARGLGAGGELEAP